MRSGSDRRQATVLGAPQGATANDDRSATRDSGLTKNVDFMSDLA